LHFRDWLRFEVRLDLSSFITVVEGVDGFGSDFCLGVHLPLFHVSTGFDQSNTGKHVFSHT
jgi:hypothetical protein